VCESRSVPSNVRVNDSILSDAARCRVAVAETATTMGQRFAGKTARRKASWVVPPFSPHGEKLSSRGENGGTILVRRVKPSRCTTERAHGGSYRSAWNRRGGARGRQGTSEDGTISVKAPPAVARDDQARGVRIQNAGRRYRAASCSGMVPAVLRGCWGRGCIEIGSAEAGASE
jgi:hypothetical protein